MILRRPVFAALLLLIVLLPATATTQAQQAAPPMVGSCQVFPADNPWNTDISGASVAANSTAILQNIAAHGGDKLFPDFGNDPQYYFRWIIVSGSQKKVPVSFLYDDESDPGPYPFPSNTPIEPGGDRHAIVIDTDNCILYETYASVYQGGPQQAWHGDSGAIFNLNSNAVRADTWTSADAAGLPIFPGLARCSEAQAGEINHALRVTMQRTRDTYIYPATHEAGVNDLNAPPMGLRLRMKASYDTSGFTGQALAIVNALKKYGLIVADNGSNWYISGELSSCWLDSTLNQIKSIIAYDPNNLANSAFEVIDSPPPPSGITLPAPSLYVPLNGAEVSGTSPLLGWNTITGSTDTQPVQYQIYLDQNPTPTTLVATVPSTQLTQYTPTIPLISGFTYYWRVRAVVPDPNGDLSDPDRSTVTTGYSPTRSFVAASPANAAPVSALYNVKRPTLTWTLVTFAAGYQVQVATNSAFTGTLKVDKSDIPSTQLAYTLTTDLSDGLYYWRVRAQSSGGTWGTWSAPQAFIVDA